MRIGILVIAVVLQLLAPAALAGGISLTWGSKCLPDALGGNGSDITLQTFACDRNSGVAVMTLSFTPDHPITVMGFRATLLGESNAPLVPSGDVVPSWWQLGAGGCRSSSLSASADFSATQEGHCADPWLHRASGGITAYLAGLPAGELSFTTMQLEYALAEPVALVEEAQYLACQITIDYQKTVGEPECSGCNWSMLWALQSIELIGAAETLILRRPLYNQCVFWQGGDDLSCYARLGIGVPARNTTWGQIKSLYR